jgi:molybdenum cofactor cytidylyltransferase
MVESESERFSRVFAVIPAAGLSRRMGDPKLLLTLGGRTVIRRLLDALRDASVEERIVVCRRDDDALRSEIEAAGATAVQPDVDPPDMRTSVEHALQYLCETNSPEPDDGWLLSPADHPVLNAAVLREVINGWRTTTACILVPTFHGKRGHPTVFRWSLAEAVFEIPADRGLNDLLQRFAADVQELPVDDSCVLTDLDTPEDFAEQQRRFGDDQSL